MTISSLSRFFGTITPDMLLLAKSQSRASHDLSRTARAPGNLTYVALLGKSPKGMPQAVAPPAAASRHPKHPVADASLKSLDVLDVAHQGTPPTPRIAPQRRAAA